LDRAGNLYGTTAAGGTGAGLGSGVVFKLSQTSRGWRETVLHNFRGNDGAYPSAPVTFDTAGNLYGTAIGGATCSGGVGCGLVFKLSPHVDGNWTYTVLHGFGGMDGDEPLAGLTFDAAGNLYGTTVGGGAFGEGVVFKLVPNGDGTWSERVLHSFQKGAGGANPLVAVTFDPDGNLYGTTVDGGFGVYGGGVVYKLTPTSRGWVRRSHL
jgi:uncharacterized repeat protein (TIGR03803 family)